MTTTMDWSYPESGHEAGIFEIGQRIAQALGRVPDVSRFSYDPREMLRTTREVEQAGRAGRLLVGFQTAAKIAVETERYAALLAAGTRLTVFATGERPTDDRLAGLDYRQLAPATRALANQWFLVTDDPEPLAFLSYELGDPESFGVGGAASPGKRFVGFVSDDPGVVALLIAALDGVGPLEPDPVPPAREPSPKATEIAASITADRAVAAVQQEGSVIVPIGRGDDRRAFVAAAATAQRDGRALVIIDRGAEGFSSPYNDMRGDDASRPSPDRLVSESMARREGRSALADFLAAARILGLEAGGWFPTKSGGEGIAEAIRRFGGALVILPPEAARPSLAERLRGMSIERLTQSLDRQVVIAG